MVAEDKVSQLFCITDDSFKFFDTITEKYTLKSNLKRLFHTFL